MIPEGAHELGSANFKCSLCDALAVGVTLYTHVGGVHFQEGKRSFEPGPRKAYLHREGFGTAQFLLPVESVSDLERHIADKDIAAIHEMHFEWAPMYCEKCKVPYCGTHWLTIPEFDDGFYDCTYGTCPKGHRQLIDD